MELIIENHDFVSIWKDSDTNQFLLKSNKEFNEGERISTFESRDTFELPTYLTVQRNDEEHFLLKPIFLQYINHSCDPNVYFDLDKNELIALKHIEVNEELSFFYPSTEWEMTQPFDCHCGTSVCLKSIKGAKYIDQAILKKYKLSIFIENKAKELILPCNS
jgi:hypothetical protein